MSMRHGNYCELIMQTSMEIFIVVQYITSDDVSIKGMTEGINKSQPHNKIEGSKEPKMIQCSQHLFFEKKKKPSELNLTALAPPLAVAVAVVKLEITLLSISKHEAGDKAEGRVEDG